MKIESNGLKFFAVCPDSWDDCPNFIWAENEEIAEEKIRGYGKNRFHKSDEIKFLVKEVDFVDFKDCFILDCDNLYESFCENRK